MENEGFQGLEMRLCRGAESFRSSYTWLYPQNEDLPGASAVFFVCFGLQAAGLALRVWGVASRVSISDVIRPAPDTITING